MANTIKQKLHITQQAECHLISEKVTRSMSIGNFSQAL